MADPWDPLNALTPEEVGFVLAAALLKEGASLAARLPHPERCAAALTWLTNNSREARARALARLAQIVGDPVPRHVHPSWIADAWSREPADLRALSPELQAELARAVLAPLVPPATTSELAGELLALPPDQLRVRVEAGLPPDRLTGDDRRAVALRLPLELGRRLLAC